jgi:hypothetical protein
MLAKKINNQTISIFLTIFVIGIAIFAGINSVVGSSIKANYDLINS